MSFDLTASLRLIDNVSKPMRSITSSLAGVAGRFGALSAAAIGVSGAFAGMSVLTDSFKKSMDFESQMLSVKAVMGGTNEEMADMQSLALKMGASTKYSAMEAGQAIEELLKAGMESATVEAGGLEAALNLATAGGLGLQEAAETMATSLNAFKKDGLSAAQASDILAGTANAGATSVHEISYALASAGGVADMFGLSLLDLNTAIGIMSNDGLKGGSDAGTSFKSMLMYLQPQTKKATQLFKKLGIGVGEANKFFEDGKIKDIGGIADVLQKAFKGFSEQERTDLMLEMFGTDGVKAASSMFKAGSKGIKEFQRELSKTTALDVAKTKMEGAGGAVEQFNGALETLQISALAPTMPIIRDFALSASDMIEKYSPTITAAVQKAVDNGKKYVADNFTNNPEFQKLTKFESKVEFVFDTVKTSFDKWWAESGEAVFKGYSEKITSTLLASLENSSSQIASIGLKIGGGLAEGIADGMRKSKSTSWIFKGIDIGTPEIAQELLYKYADLDVGTKGTPKQQREEDKKIFENWFYESKGITPKNTGNAESFANRFSTQAPMQQNITNNTPVAITLNMGGVTVKEEADVNKITDELQRRLFAAFNATGKSGSSSRGAAPGGPIQN
ncbi:phage tail tape measure protein [Paenibacillus sp. Leaf72]|uniref:phage tail tape measure protein n=1 Tax=Paenibacillus sp. Leaf72 TaxID=1736234 RepID=UPI0006F9D774|nr:phage tail tape measure protein [Paenibacillus sp. Leaf72]KQN97583.1 hypothetical protein ASF12_20435 [Paenibacillus sp. Leaf72]